jgi:hypothetical protein
LFARRVWICKKRRVCLFVLDSRLTHLNSESRQCMDNRARCACEFAGVRHFAEKSRGA